MELKFDKLVFGLELEWQTNSCVQQYWNSSFSSNSSSKNNLTYRIISSVRCFPKIFLKLCWQVFPITQSSQNDGPSLTRIFGSTGYVPTRLPFSRERQRVKKTEKEWKLWKREEIVNPSSHLCLSIFSLKTFVSIQFSLI